MNHPLIFLIARSFWNALLFRLRRLRQPKYLLGAIFGAGYVLLNFGRFLLPRQGRTSHAGLPPTGHDDLGMQFGALLLFGAILISCWILSGSRAALIFSEAEIAWLFPAPLPRAALIRYKLFKSQLWLLFAATIFAILSGRALMGGFVWGRILGWWIILATLQLHRLGASFALQRLRERGLGDARRRAAFVCGVLVLGAILYLSSRDVLRAKSLDELVSLGPEILATPAAFWLLAPFRLVVSPWFATNPLSFLEALGPALLIIGLHYFWVIRADVSFEEASIALSQHRAAFLAARQRGERSIRVAPKDGREAVFALQPTGPIAPAFFWSALLRLGGRRKLRLWGAFILGAFAAARLIASLAPWPLLGMWLLVIGATALSIATLFGPNQAGLQFRRSIESMDLLKSYPVRGWQFIVGELAAPLLCAAAIQWSALLFLLMHAGRIASDLHFPIPSLVVPGALTAAVLLPGFNLIGTLLNCGGALLLPAWFKGPRAGIEATGIRIVLFLGQFIAFSAALVPAAALTLLVSYLLEELHPGWISVIVGLAAGSVILLLEGAAGIVILGMLFDRFDVSEDA